MRGPFPQLERPVPGSIVMAPPAASLRYTDVVVRFDAADGL